MAVSIVSGPLLLFRGLDRTGCDLAALVVTRGEAPAPVLRAVGHQVSPRCLFHFVRDPKAEPWQVWRYDFTVPRGRGPVDYHLDGHSYRVFPPPPRQGLHIAYTACNGSEDQPLAGDDRERNRSWENLAALHQAQPFHLLLQGGDQLYADGVWDTPSLSRWQALPQGRRLAADWTEAMEREATGFYVEHYSQLWAQSELAPVLASVPSLMMWDDHDIFDGWGSHQDRWQACPVYQGVWRVARHMFALFQHGALPEALPTGYGTPDGAHFGWAFELNDVGIIAPDLRSERRRDRVMGEAGWTWFTRSLERLAHCRRVLLVSSVPVLNVDLSILERVAVLLPHSWLYQDDLRDQWRSYAHRPEWRRLLNTLFEFVRSHETPVTILSGEIHLGALGRVRQGSLDIHQLTASGIVHPPPPGPVVRVYELLARHVFKPHPGLEVAMLPLPGTDRRFLAARNWLDLHLNGDDMLSIWRCDREAEPTLRLEGVRAMQRD